MKTQTNRIISIALLFLGVMSVGALAVQVSNSFQEEYLIFRSLKDSVETTATAYPTVQTVDVLFEKTNGKLEVAAAKIRIKGKLAIEDFHTGSKTQSDIEFTGTVDHPPRVQTAGTFTKWSGESTNCTPAGVNPIEALKVYVDVYYDSKKTGFSPTNPAHFFVIMQLGFGGPVVQSYFDYDPNTKESECEARVARWNRYVDEKYSPWLASVAQKLKEFDMLTARAYDRLNWLDAHMPPAFKDYYVVEKAAFSDDLFAVYEKSFAYDFMRFVGAAGELYDVTVDVKDAMKTWRSEGLAFPANEKEATDLVEGVLTLGDALKDDEMPSALAPDVFDALDVARLFIGRKLTGFEWGLLALKVSQSIKSRANAITGKELNRAKSDWDNGRNRAIAEIARQEKWLDQLRNRKANVLKLAGRWTLQVRQKVQTDRVLVTCPRAGEEIPKIQQRMVNIAVNQLGAGNVP
jgi:hypothetical protein